jgi:hypothetical protein
MKWSIQSLIVNFGWSSNVSQPRSANDLSISGDPSVEPLSPTVSLNG